MSVSFSLHEQLLQKTIEDALSPEKIEAIAGGYGYSIHAYFFPKDFNELCNEVTQFALDKLNENLQTQDTSSELPDGIEDFAKRLVQDRLSKICIIVNRLSVRNPPPSGANIFDLCRWIASWCRGNRKTRFGGKSR